MKKLIILGMICLFIFTACHKKNDEKYKNNANKETPEPVIVTNPEITSISDKKYFTSTVSPWKEITVISEVNGIIDKINVTVGNKINENDILAEVKNKDLILQKDEIETKLNQSNKKLKKIKKLFDENLATEDELDLVENENSLLKINLDQIKNELDKSIIKSTISGTLIEKYIEQGQYVSNYAKLFTIMDLTKLKITGNLPEKVIGSISKSQKVDIFIPESDDIQAEGRIYKIYPVVDPQSGTFKVEVLITENKGNLKAGQFVKCFITTDIHNNIVVLPKKSIVWQNEQSYVYVISKQADKKIAKKTAVKTGLSAEDKIEIIEGVDTSDTIIVSGQFNIEDTGLVKIIKNVKKEIYEQ